MCPNGRHSGSAVKAVGQAAAVDVEGGEDFANGCGGDPPIETPLDDIEVFLAGFEAIENTIEKEGVIDEAALKKAEVTAVKLDPEARALEVLHPASPQVAPPVFLHPGVDGDFSQVAFRPLAFDPLVGEGFLLRFDVDATL